MSAEQQYDPQYQYETVLVEKPEPRIGILWLNRPDKRNSISPDLSRDMNQVLPRLAEDDDIRVLIVSGKGSAFCAGMDLGVMLRTHQGDRSAQQKPGEGSTDWWRKLREFPKPTIAAVNGHAYGGGLLTIGMCDLAIASEQAMGGLSEINWGTPPGGGATRSVLYNMLPKHYNYLLYTGLPIDGREMERMGVVNRAVPHEQLMETTLDLARVTAKHHPVSLDYLKRQVRGSENIPDYYLGVDFEGLILTQMRNAAGYQGASEGLSDFVDKKYRPGLEAKDYA